MIIALLLTMLLIILLTAMVIRQQGKLNKLHPRQPICGCHHHLSYHDPKTRLCNGYEPGVVQTGTQNKVTCRCRGYIGPEPYTEYFVPEITN